MSSQVDELKLLTGKQEDELSNERAKFAQTMKHLEEKSSAVEAEKAALQLLVEERDQAQSNLKSEIQTLVQEASCLKSANTDLITRSEEAAKKQRQTEADLEAYKQSKSELLSETEILKSKTESLGTEALQLEERVQESLQMKQLLQDERDALQVQVSQSQGREEEARRSIVNLEEKLSLYNMEIENLYEETTTLKASGLWRTCLLLNGYINCVKLCNSKTCWLTGTTSGSTGTVRGRENEESGRSKRA